MHARATSTANGNGKRRLTEDRGDDARIHHERERKIARNAHANGSDAFATDGFVNVAAQRSKPIRNGAGLIGFEDRKFARNAGASHHAQSLWHIHRRAGGAEKLGKKNGKTFRRNALGKPHHLRGNARDFRGNDDAGATSATIHVSRFAVMRKGRSRKTFELDGHIFPSTSRRKISRVECRSHSLKAKANDFSIGPFDERSEAAFFNEDTFLVAAFASKAYALPLGKTRKHAGALRNAAKRRSNLGIRGLGGRSTNAANGVGTHIYVEFVATNKDDDARLVDAAIGGKRYNIARASFRGRSAAEALADEIDRGRSGFGEEGEHESTAHEAGEYHESASKVSTSFDALRCDVVAGYAWAWRRHYGVPEDVKIARDAATISDAQLVELQPHLLDLVNRLPPRNDIEISPVERASRRFFSQWCRRNGKNDCLKNARHPLWRLSKQDIFEDFATVFAKLAKEHAERNAVEENPVASRKAPAREMIAPAQGDVNFREFIAQQTKTPAGARRRAA